MGDKSKIEWTDATWNPTSGCSKVSAGCKNCYAERTWKRLSAPGQPYDGRKFTDVQCHPDRLDQPLRWRKPRRIFVDSMSDLFHEDVPFEFIARVWNTMFDCGSGDYCERQHTFQILTKRPQRALEFSKWMDREVRAMDYRNVWLGVSVEDQATADERIPILLQTPAAVRFVSYEPALEMVDFDHIKFPQDRTIPMSSLYGGRSTDTPWHLNWIVLGGENGPGARPMHPEIPRSVRDQCAAADVPFFFKGWGKHKPVARAPGSEIMDIMHPDPDRQWFANVGKKAAGCLLDGREHKEMPGVG